MTDAQEIAAFMARRRIADRKKRMDAIIDASLRRYPIVNEYLRQAEVADADAAKKEAAK